ncbi:MAG: hypothetical protein FWD92_04015 [Methanomassiliicoccaceae archaeon]|nr:hypothetical protein [Methanomassiliicoccaceae archaeon]
MKPERSKGAGLSILAILMTIGFTAAISMVDSAPKEITELRELPDGLFAYAIVHHGPHISVISDFPVDSAGVLIVDLSHISGTISQVLFMLAPSDRPLFAGASTVMISTPFNTFPTYVATPNDGIHAVMIHADMVTWDTMEFRISQIDQLLLLNLDIGEEFLILFCNPFAFGDVLEISMTIYDSTSYPIGSVIAFIVGSVLIISAALATDLIDIDRRRKRRRSL